MMHRSDGFDTGKLMAWITSLLADHQDALDEAWLLPAVTVDDFLAPFVENARLHASGIRAEYEAAIAADRQKILTSMRPGDQLHPWQAPRGSQQVGLAVLRDGNVIKSWLSATLGPTAE